MKIKSIKKYKTTAADVVLSLNECQQILLKTLYSFQRFCAENDLRFSLAYGSLIGAAREQNIINWDNDIDIMMPQEEFDKLLNSIDGLNRFGLNYYHYTNATHVYSSEVRIYFNGYYRFLESDFCKYITPLCIDVFPLVKIDTNADGTISKKTKKKIDRLNKIKRILYYKEIKHKSKNWINTLFKMLAKPLLLCVPSVQLNQRMDKIVNSLYSNRGDDYMLFSPNALWFRLFDKHLFDEIIALKFGSEKVCSIANYDYFLTNVYGEWKKPCDRSNGDVYESKYLFRAE